MKPRKIRLYIIKPPKTFYLQVDKNSETSNKKTTKTIYSFNRFGIINLFKVILIQLTFYRIGETNEESQQLSCNYHDSHCFFLAKLKTYDAVFSVKYANDFCRKKIPESYLVEPYDQAVHEGAKKFLSSHGSVKKSVYPTNAAFELADKYQNMKMNEMPEPFPAANLVSDKSDSYVYGIRHETLNNTWDFKTADHEQYHTVVCLLPIAMAECTKTIKPSNAASRTFNKRQPSSNLNNVRNVKKHSDECIAPGNKLSIEELANQIVSTGKSNSTMMHKSYEQMWREIESYLNTTSIFRNNSDLTIFLEKLVLYNKTSKYSRESIAKLGIQINNSASVHKLFQVIKMVFETKHYFNGNTSFLPVRLGQRFKENFVKFMNWLKNLNFGLICRYLEFLNNPLKFSEEEAELLHIPRSAFRIYTKFVYPPIAAALGHEGIRNLIVQICYTIHKILSPLLKINWKTLFNKNLVDSIKNLDFQMIGDFIMENKEHLTNFSREVFLQMGVPTNRIDEYEEGFYKLVGSLQNKSSNVNALIGVIKNGKICNWQSFIRTGKTYFTEYIKGFNFKKIGQIMLTLYDKIKSVTIEEVRALGLNIKDEDFEYVQKIFHKIEKTMEKFNLNITFLTRKIYHKIDEKIAIVKSMKISGLNVNKKEIDNIEKVIILYDLISNPHAVTDGQLFRIGIRRSQWNDVVQRIADNAIPYSNEDPSDILHRFTYLDKCLVVYRAVTSWYEAQSMCAANNGNLVVFDEYFPTSVFNDPKIFGLNDFPSFWTGATKHVWTWRNKKSSLAWNTLSSFTAFYNGPNYIYLQSGDDAYSWMVSERWYTEAGQHEILCMTKMIYVYLYFFKVVRDNQIICWNLKLFHFNL
ncbi:hypothetical protein HELRODRAFT_168576 [Helobdella robusta]|uniref:C-type lectin domain-containing protein n=1 Tax=Helobdella robusta TaxID=6412 RepID=T1F0R2_HELRO|nr:hypothetical protein HELRODRAFT_168576 [Helobdella robusta]ESO09571.1 hypothetical protein HELRODRAFT_168576 [Helobdella robusta]